MIIKLSEKIKLNISAEYNAFITSFIDKLPPDHSGIYLYCVKNAAEKNLDTKLVSETFGIGEMDVVSILSCLEGIVSISGGEIILNGTTVADTSFDLTKRPEYDADEITFSKKHNPEIAFVLKEAENKLGRMLNPNDIKAIYSYYDFYKLPADVIMALLDYCTSRNKRNLSYLEKVALDWAENGINTVEKAEIRIREFMPESHGVLKAFGITGRTVTPGESELIEKWKKEFSFDMETIIFACELTIAKTGKASFPYADKILTKWSKKGIKTLEEAKKDHDEFIAHHQKEAEHKKNKNSFTSFTNQRKYNYSDLEKMLLKKQHKNTEDK